MIKRIKIRVIRQDLTIFLYKILNKNMIKKNLLVKQEIIVMNLIHFKVIYLKINTLENFKN